MLFDKLAGFAERELVPKRFQGILREAKLFHFPGRAHEDLPFKDLFSTYRDYVDECFYLPFPKVAIEDTATCVVLWDYSEEAIGLSHRRGFIEISSFDPKREREFGVVVASPSQPTSADRRVELKDQFLVTWGELEEFRYLEEANFQGRVIPGGLEIFNKFEPQHLPGLSNFSDLIIKESGRNALIAMEEVAFFNLPSRWLVEKAQVNARGHKDPKRILRSQDRPTYTILDPEAIRKILCPDGVMEDGSTCGTSPQPHYRRRHPRVLRADRFATSGRQGSTIFVKATWVGPVEKQVGSWKYKVLVDK